MPIKTPPPHLRAATSVPRMMWAVVGALLPLLLASLVTSGFQAFRVLVVATASALLSETAARRLLGKPATLYDGSAVVTAFLLALLLPPDLPSWVVALGAFFAITFGKEVFGGLGQNPLNPALVGCAFLLTTFPQTLKPWTESLGGAAFPIPALAVLVGGALLFGARLIVWEVPLLYLASVFCLSAALGQNAWEIVSSAVILLAAFFLVTDPVTSPLTRSGEYGFAIGCGIATAVIRLGFGPLASVTHGILLMNLLNPWLDRWIRPRRGRPR